MAASADNGAIDAAGRFQLRGIIGRAIFVTGFKDYNVRLRVVMKSVTLNGADITDTPIDIPSAGDITGIEITLTDTLARLSGTVANARREAVNDYVVVILPERLKEGMLPGRFTRTARPNQEGRSESEDSGWRLPCRRGPGIRIWQRMGSRIRKQVEPAAKRFRLTHGQMASLDLELMP